MIHSFRKHINELIPSLDRKTVYIAVSGGIDSMVLTHLCQQVELNPIVLHCNFKLRGVASDLDEDFVKNYCKQHKLQCESIQFQTLTEANKRNISIQECARDLRYEWFDTFLKKNENAVLFTAHHIDDSIETFFINLTRGTSLKGLAGIPDKRGQIYRPLLHFSKSEIEKYAKQHQLSNRIDESNNDTKYTRNKIRHDIIPEFEKISSGFKQKMMGLLSDLRQADLFIESQASQYKKSLFIKDEKTEKIAISDFQNIPQIIKPKLLANYGIQRIHVGEIEKLCLSQTGSLFKTDQFVFLKDREFLIIQEQQTKSEIDIEIDSIPCQVSILNKTYHFTFLDRKPNKYQNNIAYIDYESISLPINIQNRYLGLKIQPLGMKGSKLVSNILIDAKVNQFEKDNQLVLTQNGEVIWVIGRTISEKFSLKESTKKILKIELLE